MSTNTIIGALIRAYADFRLAMCKLNELQFSAPWNPKASRCAGPGL